MTHDIRYHVASVVQQTNKQSKNPTKPQKLKQQTCILTCL